MKELVTAIVDCIVALGCLGLTIIAMIQSFHGETVPAILSLAWLCVAMLARLQARKP